IDPSKCYRYVWVCLSFPTRRSSDLIACWFVYRYERQQGAAKRQVSEAHAETEVRFLSEALKQTRLVRGYNMEEFEQTLFSRHMEDRKSTRLNSSHVKRSYAVFFMKK